MDFHSIRLSFVLNVQKLQAKVHRAKQRCIDNRLWCKGEKINVHKVVRQSLGDPDPFRLKYRDELGRVVNEVVIQGFSRGEAHPYLVEWSLKNLPKEDQEHFVRIAEIELSGLHEGNFARHRIRPSEFDNWHGKWTRK